MYIWNLVLPAKGDQTDWRYGVLTSLNLSWNIEEDGSVAVAGEVVGAPPPGGVTVKEVASFNLK